MTIQTANRAGCEDYSQLNNILQTPNNVFYLSRAQIESCNQQNMSQIRINFNGTLKSFSTQVLLSRINTDANHQHIPSLEKGVSLHSDNDIAHITQVLDSSVDADHLEKFISVGLNKLQYTFTQAFVTDQQKKGYSHLTFGFAPVNGAKTTAQIYSIASLFTEFQNTKTNECTIKSTADSPSFTCFALIQAQRTGNTFEAKISASTLKNHLQHGTSSLLIEGLGEKKRKYKTAELLALIEKENGNMICIPATGQCYVEKIKNLGGGLSVNGTTGGNENIFRSAEARLKQQLSPAEYQALNSFNNLF